MKLGLDETIGLFGFTSLFTQFRLSTVFFFWAEKFVPLSPIRPEPGVGVFVLGFDWVISLCG